MYHPSDVATKNQQMADGAHCIFLHCTLIQKWSNVCPSTLLHKNDMILGTQQNYTICGYVTNGRPSFTFKSTFSRYPALHLKELSLFIIHRVDHDLIQHLDYQYMYHLLFILCSVSNMLFAVWNQFGLKLTNDLRVSLSG